MSNLLVIARKEFVDLLNNRMVLIVLIAFLIYIVFTVNDFKITVSGSIPGAKVMFSDNTGIAADNYVFYSLTWFGTILGIIIGCSTISSERIGNALNMLTTKPVYRDSIINGKLLGVLSFLSCVLIFYILAYTICFFILCGNSIAPFLPDYFYRLPFVFIFSVIFIGVFLSAAILISLLVSDQALAMILSTSTVYVSLVMHLTNVAGYLDNLFPGYGLQEICFGLSPSGILRIVQDKFMNTRLDAVDAFINILPETAKLLLYIVIALMSSYIIFIERDIS